MIRFCLNQTAGIRPFLRETMDGEVFGDMEVRPCRLEEDLQIRSVLRGFHGEVENEKARAILYTEGEPVPVRSRVTVDNREYTALSCAVYRGFPGSYLEVLLA